MTSHPSLNTLITAYAQGKDPASSLGPHWQQLGRSILDNHLLDVPDARDVCPGKVRRISKGVLYWLVLFLNIFIFVVRVLTYVCGKATITPTFPTPSR